MLSINKHRPVTVIFDSAAGSSVLDRSLARTLALPDRGSVEIGSPGANLPVTGFMTEISSARLGEADIERARTVAMDLPDRLQGVSGIVSPYAFAGRLVRFEFARSRAIVSDKNKASIPTGASYPYGGEHGHLLPAIEVDVVGTKVDALLDSGSKYGLQLPLEYAKRVPLRGELVAMEPVQMIGGTHAAFRAIVAGTVHIGSLTFTDPEIQFVEGVPIANVGILVLKSATLVLDPEDERSWLLPAN
jgi:predicted aspartyl protease